jgi:outer membrane protein assembly factor BamA
VKSVFGINLSMAMIQPLQNRQLTYYDYFFLGGENNGLRGFRYYSAGVVNDAGRRITEPLAGGFVLGGKEKSPASLEYHFIHRRAVPPRALRRRTREPSTAKAPSGDQPGGLQGEQRILLEPHVLHGRRRAAHPGADAGSSPALHLRFNLKPRPEDEFEHFTFSIGTSF